MIYRFIFCLSILFSVSAEASFVSYKAIDAFHKSRIDSLSKEYNLDNRALITYSLLPNKKIKKSKNEILKLPGLFLDAVSLNDVKKEVGLVEIMDELKDYNRKIVILQSSKLSDKEVKVVKQALQDELFITDLKSFEIKPWSTHQIWYNNLKTSFQDKIMASPYTYIGILAFAILSFLLFNLSSSILKGFKNVGKSIFDSVEKSMSGAGFEPDLSQTAPAAELPNAADQPDGSSSGRASDSMGDMGEKALDCHAILKLITKTVAVKPNELKFQMWEIFPEVHDQLGLYIAFETELKPLEMESFSNLFNSIFKIDSGKESEGGKNKSSNIQSKLWRFRLTLTHLVVKPLNENREKIFGLFTENYSGQLDAIVDGSFNGHFKILSYLFKDKVNSRISSLESLDETFSDQILSYVASDMDQKVPSDIDIKNFEQHLQKNKFFLEDSGEEARMKDFELLSRLPDHILFSSAKLKVDMLEAINQSVPNLSWINLENKKAHKNFILSLAPDEAAHFMKHFDKIEDFKLEVDTRTASRLQELRIKSKSPESVKAIMGLRTKIQRFYAAPSLETADELKTAA